MLKPLKESGDYLGQIRNNTPEKVEIIEQALSDKSLPVAKDGKIKIVELGTGGGESLRRLKSASADDKNIELIAVDILPGLAASLKKELDTEAVAADAGDLPFADGSVSAINASAIIHEISSYGTNGYSIEVDKRNLLYGREAVLKTFGELNRVLVPGGIVAYRDVSAPLGDFRRKKTVEYYHKSWQLFAEWFLQDFSNSNPHFYDGIQTELKKSENGFSLSAPVGVQREFQRHYLMLRDYLRNVKHREFGLTMLRSVWLDETEGLKSIAFSLDERFAKVINLENFERHESAQGTVYRGNSDQFDKLYDDLMAHYFKQINSGSNEGGNFQSLITEWKEREGLEHYVYGNVADILKISCESSDKAGSPYVLFPESPTSIALPPRYYYNRYLKQVADAPEFDGKQIINLKKITKPQALQSLSLIKESAIGKKVLDESTLHELESTLQK